MKLILAFLLVVSLNVNGQSNLINKYDLILNSDENGSYNHVSELAKLGNPKYFIIISSFLDANNRMYLGTGDIKYLVFNDQVVLKIKEAGRKNGNTEDVWISKFNADEQNYEKNGEQFMLFEGYLFKNVAAYYHILKNLPKSKLLRNNLHFDLAFLKRNFFKWSTYSTKKHKDDSSLQGSRVHMGAQWSLVALYLFEFSSNKTDKDVYESVFDRFDRNLRRNLTKNQDKNGDYYLWNSTWDVPFTNLLMKMERRKSSEIQDVSHGNHVIDYILTSYRLGHCFWTQKDIQYLANTLKRCIWQPAHYSFSDNVDGSRSNDNSLKNSGRKVSDGWMKLIEFDSSIKMICRRFYDKNYQYLSNSNAFLQFLSIMIYFNV